MQPRYVHLPYSDVAAQYWNVPTCKPVWWPVEDSQVFMQYYLQKETPLCPGCRSFSGLLLWGAWTSYTCVSVFFFGLGKFSSIISATHFWPFSLVLLLPGTSVIYWSAAALYYPIGLLYYNLLKKHRFLAPVLMGISWLPDNVFALLSLILLSIAQLLPQNEFSTFSAFSLMVSSCFFTVICTSINSPFLIPSAFSLSPFWTPCLLHWRGLFHHLFFGTILLIFQLGVVPLLYFTLCVSYSVSLGEPMSCCGLGGLFSWEHLGVDCLDLWFWGEGCLARMPAAASVCGRCSDDQRLDWTLSRAPLLCGPSLPCWRWGCSIAGGVEAPGLFLNCPVTWAEPEHLGCESCL